MFDGSDADAGSNPYFVAEDIKRLLQRPDYGVAHLRKIFFRPFSGEQGNKLIACKSNEYETGWAGVTQLAEGCGAIINFPARNAEAMFDYSEAGFSQQFVTSIVTKRVVDALESVEIDEEHRSFALARPLLASKV